MILRIRDADGNVQEVLTIRGEDGKDYVLTEADKQEIANIVLGNLNTETFTFTLEDGSVVTKQVLVK